MTHQDRRIQAVIFDLDDTLIDWSAPAVDRIQYYRPRVEKVRQYLINQGHDVPPADIFFEAVDEASMSVWEVARESWQILSFGQLFSDIFERFGLDVGGIDSRAVLETFSWEPWPGVVLFSDTTRVLGEVRRRGYATGLLTNSYLPMWMRDVELQVYQILHLLDFRVSSGDVGYLKPHPAIYEHTLDLMGVSADRAVFVGDRPANDIAGANEVGLISVLMDPPHLNRELNGVRPDYTIQSLSELLPILEQLS